MIGWSSNKKVPSSALKVNFDAANIAWAGEAPAEACKALIDEIVHVHLKDISFFPDVNQMENEELQDCVLGKGIVDYQKVLNILKTSNLMVLGVLKCIVGAKTAVKIF